MGRSKRRAQNAAITAAAIQKFKNDKIARLELKRKPGQHILTCSHCDQMGIFPISQIEVWHVRAAGCRLHPGEISGAML